MIKLDSTTIAVLSGYNSKRLINLVARRQQVQSENNFSATSPHTDKEAERGKEKEEFTNLTCLGAGCAALGDDTENIAAAGAAAASTPASASASAASTRTATSSASTRTVAVAATGRAVVIIVRVVVFPSVVGEITVFIDSIEERQEEVGVEPHFRDEILLHAGIPVVGEEGHDAQQDGRHAIVVVVAVLDAFERCGDRPVQPDVEQHRHHLHIVVPDPNEQRVAPFRRSATVAPGKRTDGEAITARTGRRFRKRNGVVAGTSATVRVATRRTRRILIVVVVTGHGELEEEEDGGRRAMNLKEDGGLNDCLQRLHAALTATLETKCAIVRRI